LRAKYVGFALGDAARTALSRFGDRKRIAYAIPVSRFGDRKRIAYAIPVSRFGDRKRIAYARRH
jgi:hypothetical protein